ncbi:MAG: MltA domain-containing protein [Colwellia sp.]|nr:MltA domain-containing protein [Colwellia sp.]
MSNAFEFSIDKGIDIPQLADFKGSELCTVGENTQKYLNNFPEDKFAVHAGSVFKRKITLNRIKETLNFICITYRDDVKAKRQSRLHNREFIKQHFDFYSWSPDIKTAREIADKSNNTIKSRLLNNIPSDQIFLTKYYTKLLDASEVRTDKYTQALYALPEDEKMLSAEQSKKIKSQLTRFKYTRQQVISGALLDNKLVKPLIWLTEEALHDVLLQGTGVVIVNGITRYFNVHRNNGIAYNYSVGKREQARYWYFIEVPSIMGYGQKQENKIAIKAQVTFAGNVKQLGLGKLFMVSYTRDNKKIARLGVLADQGGAFANNLFQLDLLVNSYKGWQDYHQANNNLPDYAKAWLMMVKVSEKNIY